MLGTSYFTGYSHRCFLSVRQQQPPSTTIGWASKYFYLNLVLFNLFFLTVTERISHQTVTTNSSTIISRDNKANKSKETNRSGVVATPSPTEAVEKRNLPQFLQLQL
ncbi:hypothetical protein L873DRAFT_1820963, partial [Choiromyces venosus 120613-1]